MTKLAREHYTMALQFAHKHALELLDETVARHEEAARSLKGYRERFKEACDKQISGEKQEFPVSPNDVLQWFMNDLKNLQFNLRTELFIRHASDIASSDALRKRVT